MTKDDFKKFVVDRLSEIEPTIGEPASPALAALIAECKATAYRLGLHSLAYQLPDSEDLKTPLACSNSLRLCLAALGTEPAPVEGDTLNPPEISKQLRVSADTVRSWIATRQLKASNLASGKRPRWVVRKADLQEFLATRQPQPLLTRKPCRRKRDADGGFRKYRD